MYSLYLFLLKNGTFLLFILLEIVSLSLMARYNSFQRATVLNTTNAMSGAILEGIDNAKDFVQLKQINDSLSTENARLLEELAAAKHALSQQTLDSLCSEELPALSQLIDTLNIYQYDYTGAKIINKTMLPFNNYLTINKGRADGIEKEMGVISSQGVVGVVQSVAAHYSIVIPLVHKGLRVSSKLKSNNLVGSLRWEGPDMRYAILDDIPKHFLITIGDTILTSGYSSFFPPDVMIGTAESWSLPEGRNFYQIKVKLADDFRTLQYVYVINFLKKNEKNAIEATINRD